MTLQAELNNDSMSYIPEIQKMINEADGFAANQMKQTALREMMNYHTPICSLNEDGVDKFQNMLKEMFEFHGWVK
ncbi:MAG TPA: hypothetical protein ENK06_01510 [Gammaproteobacteria bacterium]|nr:hypothetical protein [Gammaproteobacteria bacterium]